MTLYTNERSLLDKRHRKYFNFYKQFLFITWRKTLGDLLKIATLYSIKYFYEKKIVLFIYYFKLEHLCFIQTYYIKTHNLKLF